MASVTLNQQPFRFLDLPAELRCCVYENIEVSTTWNVLDRTQALICKRDWPIPPTKQVYDSRVTLIRRHAPLEILLVCRLVNEEARTILKHKIDHCKFQPVRYLVDYYAAWALVRASSPIRSCLGVADGGISKRENRAVRDFLQTCTLHLSQTRRIQNGMQGIRAIEMTITHDGDVAYGREVIETIMWLLQLRYCDPTRLIVVYKSPLPRIQMLGNTQTRESNDLEELLLANIPRESENSNRASSESGVFVRPLQEEAFVKHVAGLESF